MYMGIGSISFKIYRKPLCRMHIFLDPCPDNLTKLSAVKPGLPLVKSWKKCLVPIRSRQFIGMDQQSKEPVPALQKMIGTNGECSPSLSPLIPLSFNSSP